jgi:hypothetical protein
MKITFTILAILFIIAAISYLLIGKYIEAALWGALAIIDLVVLIED